MCLFVYLFDGFWPFSEITSICHHQHQHAFCYNTSSQFCVFRIPLHAHHQEPERKATSLNCGWVACTAQGSVNRSQAASSQCSWQLSWGLLKYSTRNRAKGCLHQPGAKWWRPHPDNGSVEALSASWLSMAWSQSGRLTRLICLAWNNLVEELHAAYTQQWEEEVTNARQHESVKEHEVWGS